MAVLMPSDPKSATSTACAATLTSTRTLQQHHIDDYGVVSASDGRVHTDPEWATPRHGTTLAQAMMVLGMVDIMVGEHFGVPRWTRSGEVSEVKFVAPLRPGDRITAVVQFVDENAFAFESHNQNRQVVMVGRGRVRL